MSVEVIARLCLGATADDREIEETALRLREEILEGAADDVQPNTRRAPDGTKPGDLQLWETLVITLAASGGVLTTLITSVSSWLARQREETAVVLEIDGDSITLPGATEAERQQLVEAFIKRHG
ncbi:hypothetical protein OG788_30260 [Streptomyces sp. NBC_00647]|uniref:effector-associated constant component EACC1 n=1 Tax=Streptomyces sp. NBC_00647 TaxID=2975796 RepID=UPI0032468A6A